jgi:HK97 gp10 family phage protein
MNVDITGIEKTLKLLPQVSTKTVANVITRLATYAERTAKKNIRKSVYATPPKTYVRTGKAAQSITRGPIQGGQRVYMGVKYGKYLEEGTGIYNGRKAWYTKLKNITGNSDDTSYVKIKGMRARPFWKPAFEATEAKSTEIAKKELNI